MIHTPDALRTRRVNRKLSLRALARALKISHQHLHELERGFRHMSPVLAARYLKALRQIPRPDKPGIAKAEAFRKAFPHPIESNEWKVKWPIQHANGKTYNPDFWCPALGCYIEVCTSWPNYSSDRAKWAAAIAAGYALRVYWWQGQEITEAVKNNEMPSDLRQRLGL